MISRVRRGVRPARPLPAVPTVAALLAAVVLGVAPPASGYPTSAVPLQGHGWGHGRGMGQYGSLGYAVNHGWGHERILDHFYGNTRMGQVPDHSLTVWMTQNDNRHLIVTSESPMRVGEAIQVPALKAVRLSPAGLGYLVEQADSCAGPWTTTLGTVTGPIAEVFPVTNAPTSRQEMLQACFPEGNRWLRGSLIVHNDAGTLRTVNRVNVEAYLRGVVPRESPASWADLGGGKGINALRAQAVTARSYGLAEALANNGAGRFGYAQTCNTIQCQVYAGVALQAGTTFTPLEDPRTDRAIAETAGQVRLMPNGSIARTEYSSSTGGWTAGGVFPAVVDEGDRVAGNPNHVWTTAVPVPLIEQKWPQIGQLAAFEVTKRNGYGDWGGRAVTVRLTGTRGSVTLTGNQARMELGLKSDWFRLLDGYWILGEDGGIFTFGSAEFFGSTGGMRLARPVVGMDATPTRRGYWLVASDGGIFNFGDAGFHGSAGAVPLAQPIVGMASTPSGKGYWLVAADGGIFAYGDARFHGSTGGQRLVRPIVGMAATPSGKGYWLVAADGGIFAFGDARFHGSTGNLVLNRPVVGMAPTASGRGYWLLAADGGIFAFGDASFHGSVPGLGLRPAAGPVTAIAATDSGAGYYVLGRDGGVFAFGDAGFFGSVPGVAPTSRTAKIAIVPSPVQPG